MTEPTFVAGNKANSTGTANTIVAPLPAGIVTGDVLLIAVAAMSPSGNAFTVPSGWTNLYATLGTIGSARYGLWAKIYDSATDSTANRTITMSGTARYLQAWGAAYRGVQAVAEWIIGVGKARSDSPASSTVNRAPSVTTTDADSRVLALSFERTSGLNTTTPPVSNGTLDYYAAEVDGTNQIGTFLVAHKSMPSVGATGDIDVTYPTSNASNGWAVQVALPGIPEEEPIGFEVEVTDGAGGTVPAIATVWNGTTEVAVQDILALPAPSYTITQMEADMAANQMYLAHRGGSLNWPEMSMRAYTNSIWHGCKALEVSVWKTLDGVFAMSHDNSLTRVTASTVNITASNWADIADTPIDTPTTGGVLGRLEDLLDTYGQTHVLFVEDKQNVNILTLVPLILAHIPDATDRVVFKFTLAAADGTVPTYVRSLGFKTWAYLYDGAAVTDLPSRVSQYDYIGINVDATETNWTAAKSHGIPVMANEVKSASDKALAVIRGADAFNAWNVLDVVPKVNDLA